MVLVELLCASALAVLVLGATLITFAAVQRSFLASLYQVDSQSDQNRVLSYLRRDLRNASVVQVSAQGTQLTLTMPAQAAPTLNLNLGLPLLSMLTPPHSAPANTTIRYCRQGATIIRESNGVITELSTSATQFEACLSGSTVQINTGFQPRFSLGAKVTAAASTQATTVVHLLSAAQL